VISGHYCRNLPECHVKLHHSSHELSKRLVYRSFFERQDSLRH